MLTAAFSASRRSLSFVFALAGALVVSLGLSGCAGVVSPPGSGTGSSGSLTISNVQSAGATNSSVQLNWATNEPSTSAIDYGTTAAYGVSTPVSGAMVTAHQMTLNSLAHGTTYHYRVRSTTSSDSAASSDQTFTTLGGGNSAPAVQVTAPVVGATLSGTVNLTAVASDDGTVSGVQFIIDGHRVGPVLRATPYIYVLDTTTLANAAHLISAVATDNNGQSTSSAMVSVTVANATKDTTPPTVSITAPANGAKVSGVVAVTAAAADNVGVASLQFEIDGANVGSPDVAAPYVFSWDTSKSTNGAHTVRAIAKDEAGNSTTSAIVSVTVNNTTAKNFSIAGTVSGPGASGTTVTLTGGSVAATTTNASGAYSFASLGPGNYTVTVAHTGFTFSPTSLTTTIGTANVTGLNFTSTAVSTQTFSISGTISGTGGPGSTVTLTGTSNATTTATATGTYTFTGLAKGNYAVTASHTGFIFSPASISEAITTANVVGANFTATASTTQTFSISGTISGSGGSGATVTLTGSAVASTTANGSGAFSFSGLPKGAYTVVVTHTGFTFSPATLAATITTTNVTGLIFTSTVTSPQTFSISGTISGSGGSGASVKLTGVSAATVTANASGAYTFTGLAKGSYIVTPSKTGFTFNPVSLAETITTTNITGANFSSAATTQTFTISGTVSGPGASGTTLNLSGTASAATTSNSSGAFSFTGLSKGTYAITPNHTGFTFSPTTQSATITTSNLTSINFTSAAAATTFSISGTITPATGGSGATVILSGAAGATTTTNASGAYTFTNLSNGGYTVTPSNSGFAFTPASTNVTISGANKTGVNFTAASNKPHSVTLTWSASTSSVVGYYVYRSTTSGSGYQRLTASAISALTYEDTSVQSGVTYFYVTTSVNSAGDESDNSNEVSVTIP